jgi:hypothetical protein
LVGLSPGIKNKSIQKFGGLVKSGLGDCNERTKKERQRKWIIVQIHIFQFILKLFDISFSLFSQSTFVKFVHSSERPFETNPQGKHFCQI